MWFRVGALREVARLGDRRNGEERKLLPSAECDSRTGACSAVPFCVSRAPLRARACA